MRLFDVARFGFVDGGMLAWRVANVIPGPDPAQDRADTGNHKGHAPGVESGDQPGNHDRAESCAERRAAVEQRRTTAAFGLCHPDAVELAASWIDRRFRGAEAEPG